MILVFVILFGTIKSFEGDVENLDNEMKTGKTDLTKLTRVISI